MNRSSQFMLAAVALLGVLTLASTSEALLVSGANGSLSAMAEFSVVSVPNQASPNLVVTLTNTSKTDVLNPSQVLTAVFFDIAGVGNLNPVSAVIDVGSSVVYGPSPAGGNVGGEWAYKSGLVGAPKG